MSASDIANIEARVMALEQRAGIAPERTLVELRERLNSETEELSRYQFREEVAWREATNAREVHNGIGFVFAHSIDDVDARQLCHALNDLSTELSSRTSTPTSSPNSSPAPQQPDDDNDLVRLTDSLTSWRFWEKTSPAFDGLSLSTYSGSVDTDNDSDQHQLPFAVLPDLAIGKGVVVCRSAEEIRRCLRGVLDG